VYERERAGRVTFAEAFERETGLPLEERELLGVRMLVPVDDRLGAFGIIVGAAPETVFRTRSYGGVHLVLWAGAHEKKLDGALRRISR
jgi:hypothetical protein